MRAIEDYTRLTPITRSVGKIAVIGAVLNNAEKLKDVDALTIEYSNGTWIIKGYKMQRGAFTEEIFKFRYGG